MKRKDILKGKPSPLAIKRARDAERKARLEKDIEFIWAQCIAEAGDFEANAIKEVKMAEEFIKKNKKLNINKNIWRQLNE